VKPGLCGEKPVTNCLSYGVAYDRMIVKVKMMAVRGEP
jgi:hypothetical protein